MSLSPEQKLATGRYIAQKKMPYFSAAILHVVPHRVPDGSLNTMAITKDSVLLWDAADVAALTEAQVATSYLHEVLHVLYHHASRVGDKDKNLWNQAADLAINSDLLAAGFDMMQSIPEKKMLLPEQFKLPIGQTADWYYVELQKQQQQDQQQGKQPKEGKGCGQGKCGSGCGNEQPGEKHAPKGSGSQKDGGSKESGGASGGRSEAETQAMAKAVAAAAQAHAEKNRGSVPAGILGWAQVMLQPPKVRWQDHLSKASRGVLAEVAGATHATYNRPARKQSGLGFGMGVPVLSALTARLPRVVVAVDTSGSMSGDNAINLAMNEVHGILKTLNAPIEYITCDAQVHSAGVTRSWSDVVANLKGGGGTSVLPVFEYIGKKVGQKRPSLLIYATDGFTDCPPKAPPALDGVKTIWLICGKSGHNAPWGTNIRVE